MSDDDLMTKILATLQRLEAGQTKLEAGQAKLEAGQAKLEADQTKLEADQTKLEAGQAKLEAGQAKLEADQTKLEAGQAKLEASHEAIEARLMARMNDNQERMIERIRIVETAVSGLIEVARGTNNTLASIATMLSMIAGAQTDPGAARDRPGKESLN